jgi:cell division protein FtsI/penicillin-binding protein 2
MISGLTRIRLFSALILVFALVLLVKLFFLQVINGEAYNERADRQYVTPIENLFNRGSIFFKTRKGELVAAASVKVGFKVAINPKEIRDPEAVYEALAPLLPIKKDEFLAKARKPNDPYEEIAWRLSKETADQVSLLKLPGVNIFKEKWRFYPGGEMASHTIGFVAYNGDRLEGRYGLERFYNGTLEREADKLYVNFFAEAFANLSGLIFETEKSGNIITTLEPSVQGFLEEALAGVIQKWRSEAAGGIIMNPKTGAIYAMAHLPQFDLNKFSEYGSARFANPLVENVFEYGSIIKPLTIAAAIDAGVIAPSTTYFDSGSVVVGRETINNFDKKGRGKVSMQDVLNQSLNTGAVFAMQKLGQNKFRDYFYAFGVGEKTGISLPNEAKNLTNLESKQEVDYASTSFGQGLALTPLSAIRAFSALANNGATVTPYLISKIDYEGLKAKEFPVAAGKQAITPETAEEITRMLVTVFDTSVTKKDDPVLLHYSVAGKTGTAQIAKEAGGGYHEDKYLHTFFGYFPAFNPEFIVLLYNRAPQGVRFSSQTLAPPFTQMAKFLISYYEIPPDR